MSVKVRVFGSNECDKCKNLVAQLQFVGISFDYIDANADDTQELCDLHEVQTLPHVQLLSNEKVAYVAVDDDHKPINVAELLSQYISAGGFSKS